MNEILGTKGVVVGGGHGARPRKGSQSDDTEEEDYGNLSKQTNEDWLLTSLPNVPHFAVILPRIYPLLLRASIMETNLNCLQSYFQFLTHYPPEEKIYESAISLSTVVVDRFDIVRKLFCTQASPVAQAAHNDMFILGSLLSMLRKAMEMAIHSQTMPQLSSSEEFLLVSFPSIGKKTIIHTSLIQAIMLLLSFDFPPTADPSDYKYFLEQWFPVQEEKRPEAHAVESKEKASFPHPAILPYMLLSSSPRILSASVSSSSPSQLCSFVKQFGSPLLAVEKVLESLDGMCEDHDSSTELRRCLHDPVQMCGFVEVHILRGATSGKTFLSFLQGLASVPPTQAVTSIASVFENDAPSPPLFGFGSQSSLTTSSTVAPARKSGSQSYANLMNSSQDDLERMLQQSFSPTQGKKSVTSGKSQQIASDLVLALRHCTSVGVGGGTVGGASDVLESFVGGLIAGLDKLFSSNKTKKQLLEGMIQSRHAVSLLRMITRIIQCSLKGSEPSSHASLFRSTLQHILHALELHAQSSGSSKFAVFSTAVKSCAKQLGVEHNKTHGSATSSHKLEAAVSKSCKEVGEAKDPFRNKTALVKLCHSLTQAGLPAPFEQLVSCVAKRAISLGKEQHCIQFLYAVKTSTADCTLPVLLKFSPNQFAIRSEENGASRSQSPEDEFMETNTAEKSLTYWHGNGIHVDVCGLLIDWLELLDPEVLSLSPEHSMKLVFGCSNTEQLSSILAVIQNKEQPEQLARPLRLSPSLLLCGQGYLQDRLTNSSSWPTLVGSMKALLSSDNASEW